MLIGNVDTSKMLAPARGGVQYELLNYDNGWFKPLGDINELFK